MEPPRGLRMGFDDNFTKFRNVFGEYFSRGKAFFLFHCTPCLAGELTHYLTLLCHMFCPVVFLSSWAVFPSLCVPLRWYPHSIAPNLADPSVPLTLLPIFFLFDVLQRCTLCAIISI